MRIFFLNAYFDVTRYEGSRVHIEQLAKYLTKMGHELWVQPSSPLRYARKLSSSQSQRLAQLQKMDVYYCRIEGRPLSLPYYMREPWHRLGFKKKIVWEVNAASDYVSLLSETTGVSQRSALDISMSRQARSVDLAICNTDGLASFASDLGIRNIVTIPLATDPEIFSDDISPAVDITRNEDRLNVCWSGNPSVPWHDLETIRKAAYALRGNCGIYFYFFGEYPRGVRFTDNVILKGPISYDEMPRYLKAMDVGLAIYRRDTWSRYGVFSSPLKVFDYFAARLVVVASPIEQALKCIREGSNGFIVPFEDAGALADRLLFIAANKIGLRSLGNEARELTIKHFNWQRVAQDTAQAIQSLL